MAIVTASGLVFDATRLPLPVTLHADLCVVGSGAGGSMVAMVAAEAGLRTVVIEAGEWLTPADMTQREDEMFPLLYWDGAGRTTADRAVKIHQGRGVGGSTLHNLGLCKRIPPGLRARWSRERGLSHLPPAAWDALYAEVEDLLGVAEVPPDMRTRPNLLLAEACGALGWRGGWLRHNRTGCTGSGFCEIGCSYDAKNSAAKIPLPRAVRAGAEIVTRCQAVRVTSDAGVVTGIEAVALHPVTREPAGRVRIEAPRVCLSASATATPALLLRSRIPDPGGETGRRLRIHPGVVVAGDFQEPIEAWRGVPQSYECTELLDLEAEDGGRLWIVPAFAHPVGAAILIPGHGAAHRSLMERYAHLCALSAMLHDRTAGSVRPRGDLDLAIDYWPGDQDRRDLSAGLVATARLLRAAGARRVFVPASPPLVIERGQPIDAISRIAIDRGVLDLTAVHPMASVPMGDDPRVAAVDSRGRHHHVRGLWIADGSLFPSSIGVPPQLSIYALGLHVGRALVAAG